MDGEVESLVRVDVLRDEDGTRLSLSQLEADGSSTTVAGTMARSERLWLALVLLRGLWRR